MGRKHKNGSPFLKRDKHRTRRGIERTLRNMRRASGGTGNASIPSLFDPVDQYSVSGVNFTSPGYDGGIEKNVAEQIVDQVSAYAAHSKRKEDDICFDVSYTDNDIPCNSTVKIKDGLVSYLVGDK